MLQHLCLALSPHAIMNIFCSQPSFLACCMLLSSRGPHRALVFLKTFCVTILAIIKNINLHHLYCSSGAVVLLQPLHLWRYCSCPSLALLNPRHNQCFRSQPSNMHVWVCSVVPKKKIKLSQATLASQSPLILVGCPEFKVMHVEVLVCDMYSCKHMFRF